MFGTGTVDRRVAIRTLLEGGVALSLMSGVAAAAWSAVAAGDPRATQGHAVHSELIARIAEAILPRSETPGAIDVGVPSWINRVVADYLSETSSAAFVSELAAIDQWALAQFGASVAALSSADFSRAVATLDGACGSKDLSPALRGYVQLKELVIVGYFTSRAVQRDILKVVIVPGRFDGDVPVAAETPT